MLTLPFRLLFSAVGLVLAVIGTLFWVWMLVDCLTNEPAEDNNEKIVWVVVIALTHWLGAALYFFIRRPDRIRRYGR